MKSKLDRLVDLWLELPTEAVTLGCVAGAESAFPVIVAWASADTSEFCRIALDEMWADWPSPAVQKLQDMNEQLENFREASETDSYKPQFYAMSAMSNVAYALGSLAGSIPPKNAIRYSISALLQLTSDLDALGRNTDGLTLEDEEQSFQEENVRLLVSSAPLQPRLPNLLRQRAQTFARKFASACNQAALLQKW